IGDGRNSDVAWNNLRRVGTERVGNGKQVGVLRLQPVDRGWVASKNLLRSAIVTGAGMNQGTQHRIALRNGRMFREQFAKLQARDGGGDCTKRPSIFAWS